MTNKYKEGLRKALVATGIFSISAIVFAYFVQRKAENNLSGTRCSYLDPISIDILAFTAGIFLICDGLYELLEHKDLSQKARIMVSIRVAFGFAIVTLHTMQFIHK
jgi:hypothetical protein